MRALFFYFYFYLGGPAPIVAVALSALISRSFLALINVLPSLPRGACAVVRTNVETTGTVGY